MNQNEQFQEQAQEQLQNVEQSERSEQIEKNQERNKNNGKKYYALVVLLLLLVTISVGYAALTSSLNISGTSTIKNSTWDIDIGDTDITCPSGQKCTINPSNPDNVNPDDGTVTPSNPNPKGAVIWVDGNTVYFKHVLTLPGDTFTFNTTFHNNGTIDAKVSNVTKSSLNTTAQRFMDYTVTYANGNTVSAGDSLNAGSSATFKVTVSYKSTVTTLPTATELAQINETASGHTGATSFFTVTYEQA